MIDTRGRRSASDLQKSVGEDNAIVCLHIKSELDKLEPQNIVQKFLLGY